MRLFSLAGSVLIQRVVFLDAFPVVCALRSRTARLPASGPYFRPTVTRLERDSLPQIRATLFSGSRPTLFAFLRVSRRARRGMVVGESCDRSDPYDWPLTSRVTLTVSRVSLPRHRPLSRRVRESCVRLFRRPRPPCVACKRRRGGGTGQNLADIGCHCIVVTVNVRGSRTTKAQVRGLCA